ncbi:Uncharacterised protein [Campylobacter insulaenigrae]|uniref:hypothetical protein n=1 Tax=Campylobacter insulaenigrae TaxID=260714 RepID=UPI000F6FF129|nr:hypothetical protein [Campylobacter insulaenigrae]MCR6591870.1 hypothetical protein [Campylobacter insulaenigrae]VEJ53273.1 Uncharacterised protein [Campylobacter insulaenigrae]
MSSEVRLENIKRLQKIANEIDLIDQQIKDENVLKTLHDENAQRFIFVSLIKISESFKKIKESADDEILSLFDKKDLKRINDTRNFAAHDNEEIRLSAVANVIKYDLFRIKRSINIHIAKLEINEKQEVEIMEKVVRKKGNTKPFRELLCVLLFFGSIATVFCFNVLHIIDNIDGYTKIILSMSCVLIELIFLYTYKENASVKIFVSFLILFLPIRNIVFYTTSYDIYYLFLLFFILFFISVLIIEMHKLKKEKYFKQTHNEYENCYQEDKFIFIDDDLALVNGTGIYER